MVTEAGLQVGGAASGGEDLEVGDFEEEDVGEAIDVSMPGPFSEAFYLVNVFHILRKTNKMREHAHNCSHLWSEVSQSLQVL